MNNLVDALKDNKSELTKHLLAQKNNMFNYKCCTSSGYLYSYIGCEDNLYLC